MATALEVRGLRKSFAGGLARKRRVVLDGVGFRLEEGTALGLIGPNGSGKSTLLRILAGIEPADAGTVEVFGTPAPWGTQNLRGRIGFLPEGEPFPGELSATEALALLGALHGGDRAARLARAEELLDRVGLREHAQRPMAQFSRGMQRRFSLAQACLREPELLLLDEPTAGLDAEGHIVLAELLREAEERRASRIIASHQMTDILAHCDALIVLVAGRIVAEGDPGELALDGAALQLELAGIGRKELTLLEPEIQRLGGRIVARGPGQGALLELYRRQAPAQRP